MYVAPRKGRVSRNPCGKYQQHGNRDVAPREGRVSRNLLFSAIAVNLIAVAPREGRVSRNVFVVTHYSSSGSRAPQGAWGKNTTSLINHAISG